MRTCLAVASMALLVSCNSTITPISKQHQQPVTVATTLIPASVVWVVDKSGSMLSPINTDPPCTTTCGPGNPCPAGCTTRLDLLNSAIASTELDAGTNTLVFFPKDSVCTPSSMTETMTALSFDELLTQVGVLSPGGGTPTAATLTFVHDNITNVPADGGINGAGSLVVLITDGVPNCNPDNPVTCDAGAACQCTTSSCSGSLCSLGCLDDNATIGAATQLINDGNDLMVLPIGVGGNTADQADAEKFFGELPATVQRACVTDTDCASGSVCGTNRICSGAQWAFSNMTEFVPAALRIHQQVLERARCFWALSTVETASSIQVSLNGANVDASQWSLPSPLVLRFSGAACQSLIADASLTPSVVEP